MIVAVVIAAVVALLVLAGLVLSVAGALSTLGWLAVIAIAGVGVVLWLGDRRALRGRLITTLLAAAAAGVAAGAVALSHAGAVDQQRRTRFTQFWIVPATSGRAAEVGVRNEEHARVTFKVLVPAPPPAAATAPPLLNRTVTLDHSRTAAWAITLPPTAGPVRVRAELFRTGRPAPYRSVALWTLPGG